MSNKLRRVKYDELLRALKRAGYKEQRQRGSHIRLWRESDQRQITTVFHKGKDVPIGTLRAILKDAGIEPDEFRKLL